MLFQVGLHLLTREQKIGANFGKSNLTCQNREVHHRLQIIKEGIALAMRCRSQQRTLETELLRSTAQTHRPAP